MALPVAAEIRLSPQTQPGAKNITLAWDANTEPDLAGYNLYKSLAPGGSYTRIQSLGLVTTVTVTNLPNGYHYFVLTAFNKEGLESGYSNEVMWKVSIPPAPPKNLKPLIEQLIAVLRDFLQELP
jgi:hypothetical protein